MTDARRVIARRRVVVTIYALALMLASLPCAVSIASPPLPTASESPRARYRGRGADRRDLSRHEQTIRRGRSKIRQVLRDPKASPEAKRTATDLNTLLNRRHALVGTLKKRHKEFVAQHDREISELRELSRRAREISGRLDAAREQTIKANDAEMTELKQISARAAELAESLRTSYDGEQRARRRAQ